VTGHRCGLTRRLILSHRRALKSARYLSSMGRPTVAARCEGCGAWHTKSLVAATMPRAVP
jgi:hypothetical protein